MKRTMDLKFLCGALVACVALAGCSTKEDLDTRGEIRLGVANATRAAIDNVSDLATLAGDNIGIYGVKTAAHSSDKGADWTDAVFSETAPEAGGLIMKNVQTSGIDVSGNSGSLKWNGTYYYPLDENAGVKFCAYHPFTANVTAPAAGQAPVANFTLTGAEDLMYATPVVGWRTKTDATNLHFNHVLTQLTFVLSDAEGNFVGKNLEAIKFTGVNTTGKMNIETGEISDWATPAELSVGGIGTEGIPITETAKTGQAVGSEIMLQPRLASFLITVTIDGTEYKDIRIRPNAPATKFEDGKSYEITLIFKEKKEIGVSATVEDWKFGGTGYGEVI